MTMFILWLSLLLHPHSYERMVDRVSASVIRVTNVEGSCSGFVIAPHRVLTANHCLGENLRADGKPVDKIIKKDDFYDLLLLDVPTVKAPLQFEDAPVVRFEKLTAIGYGFGWTKLTVVRVTAMLVDQVPAEGIPPGIITQVEYIGGQSGGPLFDTEGRIYGMQFATNHLHLGSKRRRS